MSFAQDLQAESDLWAFEKKARQNGFTWIAGVDEVGRGPLAGPVIAAACILPENAHFPGLDDSKQLLPETRDALYQQLTQHPDVIYGLGEVSHEIIDQINILQATLLAMLDAIKALTILPDFLLIDGNKAPKTEIPHETIVKGDHRSQSIAAASVIAKVTRDRQMDRWHDMYPEYGFKQHKGYATQQHLAAIAKHGPCPIHRHSFEPMRSANQLKLF